MIDITMVMIPHAPIPLELWVGLAEKKIGIGKVPGTN